MMTIWAPNLDERTGPRYVAIADALAQDVREGVLPPGTQLPTHRGLAHHLGVTVGTVSRAYAEAERRGLVRGRVGSGTFVREPAVEEQSQAFGSPEWPATSEIDLSLNLPALPDRLEEDEALASALTSISSRPGLGALLQYQQHEGLLPHREAGAEWIGRAGMEVDPNRILICSGAHHALTVCFSTLVKPGDVVLTESLTYVGMKALASALHFRLHGVAMDEFGMLPEASPLLATRQAPRCFTAFRPFKTPLPPSFRKSAGGRLPGSHATMV